MTAVDDRHHLAPRVDVGALHADLAAAYAMLQQVEGEWIVEREWSRRLRVLLALAPYARRPNLSGSLDDWAARPGTESRSAWARRLRGGAR